MQCTFRFKCIATPPHGMHPPFSFPCSHKLPPPQSRHRVFRFPCSHILSGGCRIKGQRVKGHSVLFIEPRAKSQVSEREPMPQCGFVMRHSMQAYSIRTAELCMRGVCSTSLNGLYLSLLVRSKWQLRPARLTWAGRKRAQACSAEHPTNPVTILSKSSRTRITRVFFQRR